MISLLFFIIVLLIILKFIQFCIKNGSIVINTGIKIIIFILRLVIIGLVIYGIWHAVNTIIGII